MIKKANIHYVSINTINVNINAINVYINYITACKMYTRTPKVK